MTTIQVRAVSAVSVLVCAGGLTACSGSSGGGTVTDAVDTTAPTVAAPDPTAGKPSPASNYRDVDVDDFTSGTLVSWTLEGAGVDCFINTSPRSESMECTLDFTDDVRDADNGEAAGAVSWSGGAFVPVMQTGGGDGPESPTVLHPGERITAAGATCVATGERGVSCEREGQEFRYNDGDFSATGWTLGERTIVTGSRDTGGFCGEANNGLYADMWNTRVMVTRGPVDCADAVRTVDTYLATWQDGSRGNALVTPLSNGWTCSMPTAATSRADNVRVRCDDGRHGVKVPVTTPGAPSTGR